MDIAELEKSGIGIALIGLLGIGITNRTQIKQAIVSARIKESTEMRQIVKEMIDISRDLLASQIALGARTIECEKAHAENELLKIEIERLKGKING